MTKKAATPEASEQQAAPATEAKEINPGELRPEDERPYKEIPIFVNTVGCDYSRKLNIETISKKRPYESAERRFVIYAEVPQEFRDDPDAQKAVMDFVSNETTRRVHDELRKIVIAVRENDKIDRYSWIAIEAALDSLLKDWHGDNKPLIEQRKDRFLQILKEIQANLQAT